MCRFIAYCGPRLPLDALVTRPANSLIHQSAHSHEREEPLNGDGFGIAWWKPELSDQPAVFRSLTPAWSNRNLLELARVVSSECIMAHVRAATDALSVSEMNCHPFTFERFAFMHNGDLAGFAQVRRELTAGLSDRAFGLVRGTTDSEVCFAVLSDHLPALNHPDPATALAAGLAATIRTLLARTTQAGVTEASYLNFAVADGTVLAACRFTDGPPEDAETLYYHAGARYVCEGDLSRLVAPEPGEAAVLIASEPMTDDPGWKEVPVNHTVVVRADRSVTLVPLAWTEPPRQTRRLTRRITRRTGA